MERNRKNETPHHTPERDGESSHDILPGVDAETLPGLAQGQTSRRQRTQIGNFALVKILGQGGMGTVYFANQLKPVKRDVALKVIRTGRDSKKIIARFNAERQAMAMLSHRYIAKVLDAGITEDDSPYFVMELVAGVPLIEFCDAEELTIEQRLELFIKICRGIEHAHQKGIIHRDLKPSNILVSLVDGEALPKIIDFGLAKATESREPIVETELTEIGQVLGTVQYMSPEQAQLGVVDIDTRTDIYSLGVILFEMLTGSTPLARESMASMSLLELLKVIRDRETERPSERVRRLGSVNLTERDRHSVGSLRSRLSGELDLIVSKSLEKERSRRYASATHFADDIERYLKHEPILARPASVTYRVRKLFRRNRAAIVFSAIILASLILGTVFSTYWAIRADSLASVADANARESSLRALYSQTEMALQDSRFNDAIQLNSEALQAGGGWEFGFQTSRIKDRCLEKRRLLAKVDLPTEPLWGLFASDDDLIFQRPLEADGVGKFEVVRFSITEGAQLNQRVVEQQWEHVSHCNDQVFLVAIGTRLHLVNGADLAFVAEFELGSDILTIDVAQDGSRVAVLSADGKARVLSTESLEEIAATDLEISGPESQRHFSISPLGDRVLYKTSFEEHVLWDVNQNQLCPQYVSVGHFAGFTDKNDSIYSGTFMGRIDDGFSLMRFDWVDNALVQVGPRRVLRGMLTVGQVQSADVRQGTDLEDLEVGLFYPNHLSVFSSRDHLSGMHIRYSDLSPASEGEVRLLDHRLDLWRVALFVDGSIQCLEIRERAGWNAKIDAGASTRSGYFLDAANSESNYTLANFDQLSKRDFDSSQLELFKLEIPVAVAHPVLVPSQPVISADGSKYCLLWQEANSSASTEDYFRRTIAVYDLREVDGGGNVRIEMSANARFLEFAKLRSHCSLGFSACNRYVLCSGVQSDSRMRTEIYEISSGELSRVVISGTEVEHSQSGVFFATYSQDEGEPVKVYSSKGGEIVTTIEVKGGVDGLVFDPECETVYVKTMLDRFIAYSIADGTVRFEFNSRLAPKAVFPNGQLFVGIEYLGDDYTGVPYGTLFLASLRDGRVIEKLVQSHSKQVPVVVAKDCKTIAIPATRFRATDTESAMSAIETPVGSSQAWSDLHLDSYAMGERSKRVQAEIKEILETAGPGAAARRLKSLLRGNRTPAFLKTLRDCFVRANQWDSALDVCRKMEAGNEIDAYLELMVLFRLQQFDEYRELRAELLNNLARNIADSEINMRMIAVCLLPLDAENQPGVERMAEQATLCQQPWERDKYVDAVYRLGRYSNKESIQRRNSLKIGNGFLDLANAFVEKPSDESRRALAKRCEEFAANVKSLEESGDLGVYWHEYMRAYGYYREAERLLQ